MGRDVAFGFEKALDKRGISSGLMYSVVKMWLRVLEDELAKSDAYAQYGLPLFKAVAVKYGFPNPIGEDLGTRVQILVRRRLSMPASGKAPALPSPADMNDDDLVDELVDTARRGLLEGRLSR